MTIIWNKQQAKEPLFFLLGLVGISMQPTCAVVGICWIEQGAQTDVDGGWG